MLQWIGSYLGAAMRRRDLIAGIAGSVAAWPLAPRAQQPLPVIGFLGTATPDLWSARVRAFRQGLSESGFLEGRNVLIEYRWAEGENNRLPALAADLVRRQVTVLVAPGSAPAALAAQAATTTVPIVFNTAGDAITLGLVASLSRPGGNLTGVTSLNMEIAPKRLELLHQVLPTANAFALLVNPTSPIVETITKGLLTAAGSLGLQTHILQASTKNDFDGIVSNLSELRAAALVISSDAFFSSQSAQLGELTSRHGMPAIYQWREFVEAGGLMSYGANFEGMFRQVGVYTGRILNGEKPADLPVQQATNVELIINLKTAKALGLSIPLPLLGRADEVIE